MLRKAIFLDRDGTINREVDMLRDITQLKLLPGVANAIREINKLGFLVIIVTNQPVVARGWLTEQSVERIHKILLKRLMRRGARIDGVYYCPHHPNANLAKYRKKCACRKPNAGMIHKAAKDHSIDRKKSFLVGDHAWDIMAGRKAGLRTILVHTNKRSMDQKYTHIKPHFTVKDLPAALNIFKSNAK